MTKTISSSLTPPPPLTPSIHIRGSTANTIPGLNSYSGAPGSVSPMYGGSFAPMPTPCPINNYKKRPPSPNLDASLISALAESLFVLPGRISAIPAFNP